MRLDYGDVPTWFAMAGTVGALGVSLWLLSRDWLDRRRRDVESRERQARLVAGWVHQQRYQVRPYPEILIRVRNGNDLPVYDVTLRVKAGVRGTFVRGTPAVGPFETREYLVVLPSAPRGEISAPDIQFTDSAGRRWIRDGLTGVLRQLGEYEVISFMEDPAVYANSDVHPEGHPTLGLPSDPEERVGRVVS